MRAAAASRGYEITSRARQVTRIDLEPGRFDLVLAMDVENFSALTQLAELAPKLDPKQRLHIRMFSDYLDDSWPRNVPDPYYGELDGFMTVLDMFEEGCPVILQTLSGKEVLGDEHPLESI